MTVVGGHHQGGAFPLAPYVHIQTIPDKLLYLIHITVHGCFKELVRQIGRSDGGRGGGGWFVRFFFSAPASAHDEQQGQEKCRNEEGREKDLFLHDKYCYC